MQTVLLVIHLFIALALIGFVLMQRSEGGALGMGGGGGGGAGSLFSARGVGNALTRTTAILAVVFFVTSITLTLVARHGGSGSLFDRPAAEPAQQQEPTGTSGNSSNENNALPKLPEPKVPVQ